MSSFIDKINYFLQCPQELYPNTDPHVLPSSIVTWYNSKDDMLDTNL